MEVVEDLGRQPDIHVMPVGNAGNITAYWRGYSEAREPRSSSGPPKMFGVQAQGADPIVRGRVIQRPQTMASAIRIGAPQSWKGAIEAARDSGGRIMSVPDDGIADAYRALAREGLFVEPAAAASVAGLRKLHWQGLVAPGSTVVCVLTGHGLKDPDTALVHGTRPETVAPEVAAVLERLDLR